MAKSHYSMYLLSRVKMLHEISQLKAFTEDGVFFLRKISQFTVEIPNDNIEFLWLLLAERQ